MLSPLDRLQWVAAVCSTRLPGTCYRLAGHLALVAVHGTAFPSQPTMARAIGCDLARVKRAFAALERSGLLRRGDLRGMHGRETREWHMITPRAESAPRVEGARGAESAPGAQPAPPPRAESARAPRAESAPQGRDGSRKGGRKGRARPEDHEQSSTPSTLEQILASWRVCHRKGEDVVPEWRRLVEERNLTLEGLGKLLHRLAPRDRWPSKALDLLEQEAEALPALPPTPDPRQGLIHRAMTAAVDLGLDQACLHADIPRDRVRSFEDLRAGVEGDYSDEAAHALIAAGKARVPA